jgi:hypothetical protein
MTYGDDGKRGWPWGRRPPAPPEPVRYRLQSTSATEIRETREGQDRSPRVGRHSIGASVTLIPIVLGVVALGFALALQRGLISLDSGFKLRTGDAKPKLTVVAQAEQAIPLALRDPSIFFGRVWDPAPTRACGYLGSNNDDQDGADRRFIFEDGSVRLDDGGQAFKAEWNVRCASASASRHHSR